MSAPRHHLCQNCLGDQARPFEIGPERGPQMDRYRESVELCPDCIEALLAGDFATFSSRYREERTVRRDT